VNEIPARRGLKVAGQGFFHPVDDLTGDFLRKSKIFLVHQHIQDCLAGLFRRSSYADVVVINIL